MHHKKGTFHRGSCGDRRTSLAAISMLRSRPFPVDLLLHFSLVSQQSSGREWQKSWKMRMSSSAVNAAAPNFVHSLDASHAVRVINAAEGLPTLRRFMIASPVWLRKFNNFISS